MKTDGDVAPYEKRQRCELECCLVVDEGIPKMARLLYILQIYLNMIPGEPDMAQFRNITSN